MCYVPLPSPEGRLGILKTASRKIPLDDAVDLAIVATDRRMQCFSGADCSALVREAALMCLKEVLAAADGMGDDGMGAVHINVDRKEGCGGGGAAAGSDHPEAALPPPPVRMEHFDQGKATRGGALRERDGFADWHPAATLCL
jgi:SpoVK/Ycf46/Vps4 family AAA+-type ATPase